MQTRADRKPLSLFLKGITYAPLRCVTLLLFVSETEKIIVNSHSQSIVLKTDFFDAVYTALQVKPAERVVCIVSNFLGV